MITSRRVIVFLAGGILISAVAAGCGGSVAEALKKEQSIEGKVRCIEAGWMQFVGERETVYECYTGEKGEFEDIVGPTGEPLGCFVYVDRKLSEVSAQVGDEFTCYPP